jgi:hypothetical protein
MTAFLFFVVSTPRTVTTRLDRVVHGSAFGSARRRRALVDGDSPIKSANDDF